MLVDHYHLSLDQIANLTDRSISSVYFHARTKEGYIRVPTPPVLSSSVESEDEAVAETEETALSDLRAVLASGLITQENYDECVAKIKEKFSGSR